MKVGTRCNSHGGQRCLREDYRQFWDRDANSEQSSAKETVRLDVEAPEKFPHPAACVSLWRHPSLLAMTHAVVTQVVKWAREDCDASWCALVGVDGRCPDSLQRGDKRLDCQAHPVLTVCYFPTRTVSFLQSRDEAFMGPLKAQLRKLCALDLTTDLVSTKRLLESLSRGLVWTPGCPHCSAASSVGSTRR